MRSAGGGELVVARAPVVVGEVPLGADEAALFHPVEGVVQRAVVDVEAAAGTLLEPGGDFGAVHRAPRQGFEDEDVERPLQERRAVAHCNVSPESLGATWRRLGRVSRVVCDAPGRARTSNLLIRSHGGSCVVLLGPFHSALML